MEAIVVCDGRRDNFDQHECGSNCERNHDFTQEEFLYYQNLDGEL